MTIHQDDNEIISLHIINNNEFKLNLSSEFYYDSFLWLVGGMFDGRFIKVVTKSLVLFFIRRFKSLFLSSSEIEQFWICVSR